MAIQGWGSRVGEGGGGGIFICRGLVVSTGSPMTTHLSSPDYQCPACLHSHVSSSSSMTSKSSEGWEDVEGW